MSISYAKLLKIFEDRNISSYTITKKDKIIGQATWKKINEGGHIDTRTIEAICKYLNCQPSDIMEVIPDNAPDQIQEQEGDDKKKN